MKATVTREFKGCRDGEQHGRTFRPGEEIQGGLARAMVEAGYATEKKTAEKMTAPERNRMTTPDRDRSTGASQPGRVSRKTTSKKSGARAK